ncbi:MAG: adenosylmethionine decarboxylase [Candidatus Aenigmarchaeota archaeon]|nr:adenosylmethionine decarboxylase [Candidatus Aenigmarchaeota archaeon]
MNSLGNHLIVELYKCPFETLDNETLVKETLLDAAKKMDTTIIGSVFHKFSPYGVTGIVAIAESHISIHTWPEHGYAAVDIFTCGDKDPRIGADYIKTQLRAQTINYRTLNRGKKASLYRPKR